MRAERKARCTVVDTIMPLSASEAQRRRHVEIGHDLVVSLKHHHNPPLLPIYACFTKLFSRFFCDPVNGEPPTEGQQGDHVWCNLLPTALAYQL